MQEISVKNGGQQQVIETALALLLVSALLDASFWVLLPFVGVLTYAVILATATAGLFDRMVVLLGGRRLAAFSFGAIAAAITIVSARATPIVPCTLSNHSTCVCASPPRPPAPMAIAGMPWLIGTFASVDASARSG